MHYWYPTQKRAETLTKDLKGLQRLIAVKEAYTDFTERISGELLKASGRRDFPAYQMPRWIWLVSQLRLHARGADEIVSKAGAALHFLTQRLGLDALTGDDVQDLNWVLDSTIRDLRELVPPGNLQSCLGSEELARVNSRLAEYAEIDDFDIARVRTGATSQVDVIRCFAATCGLADIGLKIDALFEIASRSNEDSRTARAALLYLTKREDAVSDANGILGLINDIYVIERAYAAVESQTRCLPILEGLVGNWPFVADLALLDDGRATLDRFSQYVVGAALHFLFGESHCGLLVLRETGPYPLLIALMAALECAQRQTRASDAEVASWPVGQPLQISDGVKTFKAIFRGTQELNGRKYRLGVRNAGTILVGEDALPCIARSDRPHVYLSRGNDILLWLKERHIDPMAFLTGTGRRRTAAHEAVLLLGSKTKLDDLSDSLRPLGVTLQALVGLKYVGANQKAIDGKGSVSEQPLIYTCSDPGVAADLLRGPPGHVLRWNVIVDGARLGRSLWGVCASTPALSGTNVCVLAELYDREVTGDLIREGLNHVWYLEDQDVEVPAAEAAQASDDPVMSMLGRRSAHWISTHTIHDVNDGFLEAVAECLHDRSRRAEASGLDFLVSTFIEKAVACPLPVAEVVEELRRLGRMIRAQASLHRIYDQDAARLFELFGPFVDGCTVLKDRVGVISDIVRVAARAGERVAIVCRSSPIAEQCRTAARRVEVLANIEWLNIEALRRFAPYDRIITPAWLDRLSMRELALNGYAAHLDFVLLPFERQRFEGTMNVVRRWERQLEVRTSAELSAAAKAFGEPSGLAERWKTQTRVQVGDDAVEPINDARWEDDEADVEQLEVRAVEALAGTLLSHRHGEPLGRAQLVLFEDPGAYALLPPNGRVIVLADPQAPDLRSTNAEQTLTRSVAELRPGMLLAFPTGGDRDLIDAQADRFLTDASEVRRSAGLWKDALRRYFGDDEDRIKEFCRCLAEAGQPRDPATVRYWIYYNHTLAPRNFRAVIPLIARLIGDAELEAKMQTVLSAVDLIYRARARAAEAIVEQLSSGEIDLLQRALTFSIGDKELRYALHRIRRMGDTLRVPLERIGKLDTFGAITEMA